MKPVGNIRHGLIKRTSPLIDEIALKIMHKDEDGDQ